jgi:phenylpropionate dioxygenase-like ring-hydroxylating dioxygenase large terminal subunit
VLSREDNELLTRVGPGTPMGALFRRHWLPFMLAEELAADAPPTRVMLLGECLVAFRDSAGRAGLLGEHCPHRRASLYYGRNEAGGLRCVYHGWKFDVAGRCLEMPSEPAGSNFRNKVAAQAYPVLERAGLLWAYLGPAEKRAELPELEWLGVPPAQRYASRWVQDCNYAQALEGEIDEAHVSFLHRRFDHRAGTRDVAKTALTGGYFREDTAPRYTVHETPYGLACGARRSVEGGQYLWRVNLFLMPCFTLIPPSDDPAVRLFRAWVPADDEHTSVLCVTWRTDGPVNERDLALWKSGEAAHRRLEPGTRIPAERANNDYLIDREAQRARSFTGIAGIRAQDAMVTESAGAIVDRTREHLGTSDKAVIGFRKRLLAAARVLGHGVEPQTPYDPDCYRVRAHACLVPRDERDFVELEEVRRGMLAP